MELRFIRPAPALVLAIVAASVGCSSPSPLSSSQRDTVNADTDAATADAAGGAVGLLDVNDVSILYPLPNTSGDLPGLLAIDADTGHGQLLTDAALATAMGFSGLSIQVNIPVSAWHIVAMRFDPCAPPSDPTTPGCVAEFRLTSQPVQFVPQEFDAGPPLRNVQDEAIHLIYQLGASEAAEVAGELRALKSIDPSISTNGIPLGVHPVMAAEGLGGPFSVAVNALIEKHLDQSKLRDVALAFNDDDNAWNFAKGTFVGGVLQQVAIPFASGSFFVTVSADDGTIERDSVNPQSVAHDNLNAIVGVTSPQDPFLALAVIAQQPAIDSAVRLDNPLINNPISADCADCHQATRALQRVAVLEGGSFAASLAANSNQYQAAGGVTATFAPTMSAPNVGDNQRMFGYFSGPFGEPQLAYPYAGTPSITQGAVNGSAKVAAYINGQMN